MRKIKRVTHFYMLTMSLEKSQRISVICMYYIRTTNQNIAYRCIATNIANQNG